MKRKRWIRFFCIMVLGTIVMVIFAGKSSAVEPVQIPAQMNPEAKFEQECYEAKVGERFAVTVEFPGEGFLGYRFETSDHEAIMIGTSHKTGIDKSDGSKWVCVTVNVYAAQAGQYDLSAVATTFTDTITAQTSIHVSQVPEAAFLQDSYTAAVGDEKQISMEFSFSAPIDEAAVSSGEPDAVAFSGISTLSTNTPDTPEGVWNYAVSVTAEALKAADCTICFTIEAGADTYAYHVPLYITEQVKTGKLEYMGDLLTESTSYALIDGERFSIADDCRISSAIALIIGDSDRTVLYTAEGSTLTKICAAGEAITPSIVLKQGTGGFLYQSGKWNTDQIEVTAVVSWKRNQESPFTLTSMCASNLSFTLEEISLSLDSECVNFGTDDSWFGTEQYQTMQTDTQIAFGASKEVSFSLYVDQGYIPEQGSEAAQITGQASVSWSTEPVTAAPVQIVVGNLDVLDTKTEEAAQNTADAKKAEELEQELEELTEKTKVGLDANLFYFFTEDQMKEISEALALYISQIIAADQVEDADFFDWLSAKAQEELIETVTDRLGLQISSGVFLQNRSGILDIIGTAKDGNRVTVSFEISVGSFQMGTNDSFGATGDIRYEIESEGELPAGAVDEGMGILTYADFEAFSESILDYMDMIFEDIWGENADRVISMFVSEPWDTLLNGEYTGKAYYLATEGAKHYAKKYCIQCPVDVHVYDSDGVLCGAIEDGAITCSNENVILAVNGDEKIVILAGASYSMELAGTDQGTMNYSVEEYADGEVLRTVNIKNIPLTEGSIYSALAPEAPRIYASAYALTAADGTTYAPEEDFYGDNDWPWYALVRSDTFDDALWLTYAYYSDESLVISGKGPMPDYTSYGSDYCVRHEGYFKCVIVENGVTTVGDFAFGNQYLDKNDFRYLQMAEIGDTVKSIGNHAFHYAQNLRSIYLGSGLETIEEWAFAYCNSLETILLSPDNPYFNVVDNVLFSEDGTLLRLFPRVGYEEYVIPDTVTTIGPNALGDNQTLKKLTIPANVKELGESAFDASPALEEITLLGDFTSVGEMLFGSQDIILHWYPNADREKTGDVKRLNIGPDVTSVPMQFLTAGADMERFWVDEGNTVYSSDEDGVLFNKDKTVLIKVPSGFEGTLTIPESVETIDGSAFDGCDQLTEIRLLRDVTCDVGSWFARESSVQRIFIGSDVTQLPEDFADQRVLEYIQVEEGSTTFSSDEYGALYDKAKTTLLYAPNCMTGEFTFPDTVHTISDGAFDDSAGMTELTIPDNVKVIGANAFKDCTGLSELILEDGVETVGKGAWSGCTALAYVSIPASVTEINAPGWGSHLLVTAGPKGSGSTIEFGWTERIPDGAFEGSELTVVSFPESLKEIGSRAFYWSQELANVQLPENLEVIGARAFVYCLDLKQIAIPDSVHTIGDGAFDYCTSLTEMTLPRSLTRISDDLFYQCSKLERVIIPDGVESIGSYAFHECVSLCEIDLPADLISVSEGAFSGCGLLTEIRFPATLRYLYGQHIFSDCGSLSSIMFAGDTPQFNDYAFSSCTLTAYYPEGNDTWTADVLQNYNGTITWVSYTPELALIAHPQDVSAERNGTAVFSVRATRADAAYQWYYAENGVDWKIYDAADAAADTITVTLTKENEGWYFRCRITGEDGTGIDSKPARLTYAGQGSFGQGLHWYYEPDTDTLFIRGNGTMEEPDASGVPVTVCPWYRYRANFVNIVIEEGVQNIADRVFSDCWNVERITVAASVRQVGSDVFDGNDDLRKVVFLGDPPAFAEDAFDAESFRAYYPVGNALWTEEVRQNYGGSVTWLEGDGDTSTCVHANTRIINAKAPGCGYDGYSGDTFCDDCQEIIQRGETLPGTPHDYTDWMLEYPATIEEEGLESRYCRNCLLMDFRVIPRLETPFLDVDTEAFYFEALKWAVENGITTGTSDTTFSPSAKCMRAQVVTFLWRAVGSPEPEQTENPFVDVRPVDFYYKAVLWAVENGITNGVDATHFGATVYCNRAQVVTFIHRALGRPAYTAAENPFTDVAEDSWYYVPVLWAVENGITNGLSATSFGPDAICNRAQIVTFLYRAFGE